MDCETWRSFVWGETNTAGWGDSGVWQGILWKRQDSLQVWTWSAEPSESTVWAQPRAIRFAQGTMNSLWATATKTFSLVLLLVLKRIGRKWLKVVSWGFLRFVVVICSENSVLSGTCEQVFGPGSSQRISKWNGGGHWNTFRCWVCQECHLWAPAGSGTVEPWVRAFLPYSTSYERWPPKKVALAEKRQKAKKQYESVCEIGRFSQSLGIPFVIELCERCEGWKLAMFTSPQQDLQCSAGVCKGCQVGLRNTEQELVGKGWRLMGTCEGLIHLKCQGNHQHGKCEGSKNCHLSAFYTPQFAKRVMDALQQVDLCQNLVRELQGGVSFEADLNSVHHAHEGPCQHENHHKEDHLFVMPPERRKTVMQAIRRIHAATGHCSKEYLVRALRKRDADQDTIDMAKQFRCPSCEEQKGPNPRNVANLEDIPPKSSGFRLMEELGTTPNQRTFSLLVECWWRV